MEQCSFDGSAQPFSHRGPIYLTRVGNHLKGKEVLRCTIDGECIFVVYLKVYGGKQGTINKYESILQYLECVILYSIFILHSVAQN